MSVEQAYNSWSSQYDTNENKTRDLDIKSTIETLSNYEFSVVLELGCGTGKNTAWLLKKADQIIGLDFSQEMLNKAKEKITDQRVRFIKTDLNSKWDIENHCADVVTASLTLEHIQSLDHIFNQSFQKLKSDGLFFISELHPYKQYAGSVARFESEQGVIKLEAYTHHISDYVNSAENNGFVLIEIKEWFDDEQNREMPRLISFVFKKKQS